MDSQIEVAQRESPPGLRQPSDYVRVDALPLGDHLLLTVWGEADCYTAESLRGGLRRALTPATRSVAVEVSRLTFCDLAGLRVLHGFCGEATSRHVPVAIHGMSPMLVLLSDMFAPLPGSAGVAGATH